MSSARDLDAAVHTLVRRSLAAIGAKQGVVTLVSRASGATFVRTQLGTSEASLRPGEEMLGWMSHHRRMVCLNDPRGEPPGPVPLRGRAEHLELIRLVWPSPPRRRDRGGRTEGLEWIRLA